MDPRLPSILETFIACSREMKQHCEWMEGMLRTFQRYMEPGVYIANLNAAQATRDHAHMLEARAQKIEGEWIQPGDHSLWCGQPDNRLSCVPWCRKGEVSSTPPPVPRAFTTLATPDAMPALTPETPKPDEPKPDRFTLIELE